MRHSALLLLLSLAACGATAVNLPYAPTAAIQPAARPTVGAITVTDARGEKDPTWLGAIRGGYGNVAASVTTVRPVKDEVEAAFRDALSARGLLATGAAAPYRFDVTVNRLSCNHYFVGDGQAMFTVALIDVRTNQPVYQDKTEAKVAADSSFTLSTARLVDNVRVATISAMNQAIDEALNRPAFVAAVQSVRVAQAGP